MKILITGSNGFIGKNLVAHLQEEDNIEIIHYNRSDSFDIIKNNIENIDFIFHLAGVNRPKNASEFYEGNTELTKKIVDLIKDRDIPFIITSSIQATKDNHYGKSKKEAEDYIINNLKNYYIYRLHNVFGKWCKPNYNSVVATFCYNIGHNLDINVSDPNNRVELIYIDDIMEEFKRILNGEKPTEKKDNYCYINPRYEVSLGYLVETLNDFKSSMKSIYVPSTGNDFIKKLYSTFVSYLDVKDTVSTAKKNVDQRGAFVELMRTKESGQFSVSFSKPGIVRGNHYHHTKMERFIVIKGKAKISFKNIIDENDQYSFEVDDKDIKIVTIPVGYTHNIENIGDDEMILAIWCNELYDPKKPDTYFQEISNKKVKTK